MNKKTLTAAFSALTLLASAAFAAEQYYVVTIIDMLGDKTFEVKTIDDVKAMQKDFAAEAKVFPKALAEMQKEWNLPENKDSHQYKWQGQKLKPRALKVSQPYPTNEKALAKADKATDKELGVDDASKKKTKKKLSIKEEEKEYEERMKRTELSEVAEALLKKIQEMAGTAPAKK